MRSTKLLRGSHAHAFVIATLTPLWGMTSLVRDFLEAPKEGPKYFTQCTWDQAPHLSPATREELWKSIPSFQRDARTRGLPQLGSGAIYKIADEDILVKPLRDSRALAASLRPRRRLESYGRDLGAQDRESG